MNGEKYKVRAKVWLYPGMAGWHFVTLGKRQSRDIKENNGLFRRGFGSIPVAVTVGKTHWKTSIFPDKSGVYVLPLKMEVRKREEISEGDFVSLSVEIRE